MTGLHFFLSRLPIESGTLQQPCQHSFQNTLTNAEAKTQKHEKRGRIRFV